MCSLPLLSHRTVLRVSALKKSKTGKLTKSVCVCVCVCVWEYQIGKNQMHTIGIQGSLAKYQDKKKVSKK